MAETAEIAKVADKISREIFGVFGWIRRPHTDLNFPCNIEEHKKRTHPSDVVFSYSSPVEENRIYLNTDLKSYARDTISSTKLSSAINSLITAVDCANVNPTWRERYVGDDTNFDVHGLLFIYNHDNGYDDEGWDHLRTDARIYLSKLKKKHRLYVIGPPDIKYLLSVADDITRQRGNADKELPDAEHCSFHYPDMTILRVKRNHDPAATLEVLTSPWQVLRYKNGGKEKNQSGAFCYYRGKGETVDEFKFLLDYLFRYGLVADGHRISIRMPFAESDSSGRFLTAKEQYCKDHHNLPEFKERLDRVTLFQVARVREVFDETKIEMD